MKLSLRQIVIVLIVGGTIVINILANALPLNGLNTGQISDRFHVYFVPAGYVFSIWGLIYLGLIAYAFYQALPAQNTNPRLQAIAGPVCLSGVANCAWIFLWHYEQFVATLAAMLILLASLIAVYLRLRRQSGTVAAVERWAVDTTFSVYLGWITVATVANITAVLDYVGWDRFSLAPEGWLIVMLIAVLVISALMAVRQQDSVYVSVIVWALVGIAVRHAATPLVVWPSAIAAVLAGVLAFYGYWLGQRALARP